jgi:hypothetical protein
MAYDSYQLEEKQPPSMFSNWGPTARKVGGMFADGGRAVSPYSNRLMMAGMGMLSGNTPQQGFGQAAKGLAAGYAMDSDSADRKQEAADKKALDEALAGLMADPSAQQMYGPNLDLMRASPEFAQKMILQQSAPDQGAQSRYGLQPMFDNQGNAYQLSTDGSIKPIEMPGGAQPATGFEKVDLGTHFAIIDKRTQQVVQTIPKDIAGAASQEVQGKAQGEAMVSLPTAINTAEQTLKTIEKVKNHPGRESGTGMSSQLDPRNYLGSTDAMDFSVAAKQLKGQTFLEAFKTLKGAGAITEQEGAAATAAIARLDTIQSDSEYLAALEELEALVRKGMATARLKAGLPPEGTNAPAAGAPDLKKKYGLE